MEYELIIETYDWGILRKIEMTDHSRSIVIHPEHWEEIKKVLYHTENMIEFHEETGKTYGVLIQLGKVYFLEKDTGWGLTVNCGDMAEKFDPEVWEQIGNHSDQP